MNPEVAVRGARQRRLWRVASIACAGLAGPAPAIELQHPVLFVTQVPVPADFATIGSVFANHRGDIGSAARGGDLWIAYPDGSRRNLTAEAGYGMTGLQGANAIAVRDPAVSWDGTRAVFSMVIGAPTEQYQPITRYWQLHEITGLGQGETVSITPVAGQPEDCNNVEPTYAQDDSIVFVSDRPRDGRRHLYPQLDEYESTPTPTGLWKLSPDGVLTLMQHSPSGSFGPLVDRYGRVVFTRWDHLQQDQQAEVPDYGTFDWASEEADAAMLPSVDVFPEPRGDTATAFGHRINNFIPWMINLDGTGEETLNHVGRHELFGYFNRSLRDDPALEDFIAPEAYPQTVNWLQLAEDPSVPGRYVAIDAPEFYTHASGQIVAIHASPDTNAEDMRPAYVTPRSTHDFHEGAPPADFTGHYRNPLPLANGGMLAAWTPEARAAGNDGTRPNPQPRYLFRIHKLVADGDYLRADAADPLTPGIVKAVSWWDPDVLVTYDGPLWELSPVEVRARSAPPVTAEGGLAAPEAQAFAEAGADPAAFRAFLAQRGLGVLVSRNVTARDAADRQQPINLRVPGGVETSAGGGPVHDIAWVQFLQGDQIRGIGGTGQPRAGRRVLAQPLHAAEALRWLPPAPGAPQGGVRIASDGSIAAIVPARRAMAWQSTSGDGTPVVRERFWISVQPGEIRACDGCHGVNRTNQAGAPPATNTPQALIELLAHWREHYTDALFADGFEQPSRPRRLSAPARP